MSRSQVRRLTAVGAALVAILIVIGAVLVSVNNNADGAPVSFGPDNPAAGSQDNTNPVVPEEFQNWTDVSAFLSQEGSQWYADCLQMRVGVSREQVGKYANMVKQGHDLRFIVVSNSSVSDEQARALLKDQGVKEVDELPIKRLNGFRNTQGLPEDRCNPFGDSRSQVRVSLAIPRDENDLTKGVHDDKGVLAMCGNPWDIPPAPPEGGPPATVPPPTSPPKVPPTSPPPTTVPPPTTTTIPNVCPPGTVPYGDRCVKPPSDDGTGGNQSPASQPVAENPQGPTPGAPAAEPPPADREQGDPDGGSGDGGAGPPQGPVDDDHSGDVTPTPSPSTPCVKNPFTGVCA